MDIQDKQLLQVADIFQIAESFQTAESFRYCLRSQRFSCISVRWQWENGNNIKNKQV